MLKLSRTSKPAPKRAIIRNMGEKIGFNRKTVVASFTAGAVTVSGAAFLYARRMLSAEKQRGHIFDRLGRK